MRASPSYPETSIVMHHIQPCLAFHHEPRSRDCFGGSKERQSAASVSKAVLPQMSPYSASLCVYRSVGHCTQSPGSFGRRVAERLPDILRNGQRKVKEYTFLPRPLWLVSVISNVLPSCNVLVSGACLRLKKIDHLYRCVSDAHSIPTVSWQVRPQ